MSQRIHICAIGSFGAQIAAFLKLFIPSLARTDSIDANSDLKNISPNARVQIVAIAVPELSECVSISRQFYDRPSIFIPVVLHSHTISVGPIKGQGQKGGACWLCAERRRKQHSRVHREEQMIFCGPTTGSSNGLHISSDLLLLVASGIFHLTYATLLRYAPSGFCWQMNLMSREVIGFQVEGIHQCNLCGVGRSGCNISTRELHNHFSYLYGKDKDA